MSVVLEFGFDAAPVFSGVDRLEQKLNGMNGTVARVSTAHQKLSQAMKEGWKPSADEAQAYLEKMRKVEQQERSMAAAHQRASAAAVRTAQYFTPKAANPWASAGASQYAEQQQAAEAHRKSIEATAAAHQRAAAAAARTAQYFTPKAANPWASAGASQYAEQQQAAAAAAAQQKAAEATAAAQARAASAAAADAVRQQRAAEAAAAAQQKSAAMAAAAASAAARQEAQEAIAQRNRAQGVIDGRLQLQLIEARLAGNAKEGKQFEMRIAQLAQMRQLQSQLGMSQRDAYALSSRMAANPHTAGPGGTGGGSRGSFALGQAAMQVQDIAVQLQGGARYSTIIAQQGSQMLSAFGTGGAIFGGVVAIGGAFLSMADNARKAFDEAKKGQKEFEQDVAKTIATSNDAGLFSGAEKAGEHLKGLREQLDEIENKRSAGDVISEWFGGPSFAEKYLAAADRIAATEKIIQGDLSRAMLESSQQDTEVVMLRTSGREAEASAMERQLKLARELARIDSLDVPDDVKTQLQDNAQVKSNATGQAEAAAQAQKVADAQSQLDEQKRRDGLEEMSLAKRIAVLSVEGQKALAAEGRLRSAAAPDAQKLIAAESRRVTLQTDLLHLQKQLATEKEREAEAAKRGAEQAQREAEAASKKNSDRRNAVTDTAMEYKILQARASGNERAVEQAEREARVMERAARLEEQNGLNKQQALALAIKMTELEDRANGKQGHIYGVTKGPDDTERNGLSKPWQSGPRGPYRGMGGEVGPLSRNGGLQGYWDLQEGRIGHSSTMSQNYIDNAFSGGDSIQEHHRKNAADAEGTGNSRDNSLVDTFIEKLKASLPPALADAILAKT